MFEEPKPLASILNNLLAAAIKEPGRLATKKLGKGLRITMVVSQSTTAPDKVKLSLNRPDVYPSPSEWITVLAAMPWPVGHQMAQRGPNYSLEATFIIYPKLL
jgi:hypothetical protein